MQKKLFVNHYDMAKMSKKLATICVQAPLELSWENAKLTNLYTPEVYEWFKKLNFKKLLSRFDLTGTELPSVPEVKRVTELGEAESIFAKAEDQDRLAFEICQSKDEFGISLALSEQEVYYLAAEGFLTEEYLTDHMTRVVEQVPLCAASDVKKLLKMVHPVHREHFFDIEIAAYLINPLISSYAHEDLGTPHAALTTLKKLPELLNKLVKWKRSLFDEVEMPLVFTLFDMEQEGMRVNAEELKAYGEALVDKISALEKSIHEAAGEEFNINSPKQLGVILFEKLGMKGGKKTKTGYSTSAEVLDKLAPEHPIVRDILEYRQLTKLKSTYADGLAGCIAADGRIHSSFNQTITATGRISSTEPNLQNIPVRMELGRLIRKVFIPSDGYVFVDADYSQIELRVLAHMSGDEKLI